MNTAVKHPLIYVEWADALTSHIEWRDIEDSIAWAKKNDWIVCQAGYLLEETAEYILLASQYNPNFNQYSTLHKIPKTWIKKRVDIKINKKNEVQ